MRVFESAESPAMKVMKSPRGFAFDIQISLQAGATGHVELEAGQHRLQQSKGCGAAVAVSLLGFSRLQGGKKKCNGQFDL